jgi:hypothetical protein
LNQLEKKGAKTMKFKGTTLLLVVVLLALLPFTALAAKPTGRDSQGNEIAWEHTSCTKIQDGTLYGSDGSLLTTGYNEWGYNYQAHMFNGMYCDYHPSVRPGGADHEWCMTYYGNVELVMKWNDTWLANTDCSGGGEFGKDPDGKLDRHHGFDSYIGSGAWTTNHMWGSYELDGSTCNWDYFVKIVAAPEDGYVDGGYWHNADGTEIGAVIWGAFAVIQEVENDPCAGAHGISYLSPDHAGFGGW